MIILNCIINYINYILVILILYQLLIINTINITYYFCTIACKKPQSYSHCTTWETFNLDFQFSKKKIKREEDIKPIANFAFRFLKIVSDSLYHQVRYLSCLYLSVRKKFQRWISTFYCLYYRIVDRVSKVHTICIQFWT